MVSSLGFNNSGKQLGMDPTQTFDEQSGILDVLLKKRESPLAQCYSAGIPRFLKMINQEIPWKCQKILERIISWP